MLRRLRRSFVFASCAALRLGATPFPSKAKFASKTPTEGLCVSIDGTGLLYTRIIAFEVYLAFLQARSRQS